MFTPQQIAQNIEAMIKLEYPSISKFLEENNLQKNTISNMKSGSMPSADKFAILALCLHVTPDFLLGIQDEVKKESTMSRSHGAVTGYDEQENRLLSAFRRLSTIEKENIIGRAEAIAELNDNAQKKGVV